jgi:hypothetical protein
MIGGAYWATYRSFNTILYQKALSAADLFSDGEIKRQAIRDAEARYARPAIEYLVHAKSNAESPAYVEGLIALSS